MNSMRVLVTGATGFVGSHTAAALAGAGHDLRLFVRNADKARRVLAVHGLDLPEVALGDITDADACRAALDGCDAVVHAAGLVALESHRAEEVIETNLSGCRNVIGNAVEMGLGPVILVSSVSAMFRPDTPVRVTDPVVDGENAYSLSKSRCERYARELQENGAPVTMTYPTGVIGPDDPGISGATQAVIAFMRDVMPLTAGGFQAIDVRDLAAVHARLIERSSGGDGESGGNAGRVARGERYLVGGPFLTWREVADLCESLSGRRLRRMPIPGWMMRAGGSVCDVLKRVVDFEFPMTRESMMFATRWAAADCSETREQLGLEFRSPEETFGDAIVSLYRRGHLSAEIAGRLAR